MGIGLTTHENALNIYSQEQTSKTLKACILRTNEIINLKIVMIFIGLSINIEIMTRGRLIFHLRFF